MKWKKKNEVKQPKKSQNGEADIEVTETERKIL